MLLSEGAFATITFHIGEQQVSLNISFKIPIYSIISSNRLLHEFAVAFLLQKVFMYFKFPMQSD